MTEEIDIFSKSGLDKLLNPQDAPANPFETGSEVSDEAKYGNTNSFARHPALSNNFADMSYLDQPHPVPGGKQQQSGQAPSHDQSVKAARTVTQNPTPPGGSTPTTGSPVPVADSQLMDQLLNVMVSGAGMRMQFCQKVAQLMVENTEIMQGIMGQLSNVFGQGR